MLFEESSQKAFQWKAAFSRHQTLNLDLCNTFRLICDSYVSRSMHSVKENTLANIDNIFNSVSISYQSFGADVEMYCNLQWLSLGDCLPRKRGSDSFHLRTSFEPAPSLHDQHHPGLTSLSSGGAFHSEFLLLRINSHFSLNTLCYEINGFDFDFPVPVPAGRNKSKLDIWEL